MFDMRPMISHREVVTAEKRTHQATKHAMTWAQKAKDAAKERKDTKVEKAIAKAQLYLEQAVANAEEARIAYEECVIAVHNAERYIDQYHRIDLKSDRYLKTIHEKKEEAKELCDLAEQRVKFAKDHLTTISINIHINRFI